MLATANGAGNSTLVPASEPRGDKQYRGIPSAALLRAVVLVSTHLYVRPTFRSEQWKRRLAIVRNVISLMRGANAQA
jgi:hypothetical protein